MPADETLDAFVLAYATLGYAKCDNGDLVREVEKIAIYADHKNAPTHAALQLKSGMWTSKMGVLNDIVHTLEGIEGRNYGHVVLFMERQRPLLTMTPR